MNTVNTDKTSNNTNQVEQRVKMIQDFNALLKETQSRTDNEPVFEEMNIDDFLDFASDVINYNYGISPLDFTETGKELIQLEIPVFENKLTIDDAKDIYNHLLSNVSDTFYSIEGHDIKFSFIDIKREENQIEIELIYGASKSNQSQQTESRSGGNNYFSSGDYFELHGGDYLSLPPGVTFCSHDCNDLSKCVYTSEKIASKAYSNYWHNRYLPAGGTFILDTTILMTSRKVSGWWSDWIYNPIPCADYLELNGYVDAGTNWLLTTESTLGKYCHYRDVMADSSYPDVDAYNVPTYRYYWLGLTRFGVYVFNPEHADLPEF